MRSPFTRLWFCVAVCAALAACETDDGDNPTPDADAPDAIVGAGGEGGQGGMGGEGGEGGMGGTGGIPDGPCSSLDEDGCDAREDCAPRRDVFGTFVDCQRIEDVPCNMLDVDDCESREGCMIDGDTCTAVPVACADQADARSCTAAGCHWWGDACHDEVEPAPCDQPDPASCENAGCTWGDDGCMPTPPACEALDRQATCDARRDCRWNNNRCEVDPGDLPCGELDMRTCAEREDCSWADGACHDRPEGACAELDYAACALRPDCESNNCNCPPDAQCDCEDLCWDRVFDCANVPIDACARTPGCMIEEVELDNCRPAPGDPGACAEQRCVPDDAFRCAQLGPAACAADPGCHLEWQNDPNCNGMGDFDAGDRAAPFPGDPGCQVQVCLPGGGDRVICEDIQDARECAGTPGCQLADVCACDEAVPAPCQCEPGAPCPCLVVAPPCDCPICMDAPGGSCEGREFDACVNDPNCQWIWADGGGMDPAQGCDCRIDADGNEVCQCGGVPEPAGGWCQDGGNWMGCEGIADQRECLNTPNCEWNAFDCGPCFDDGRGNVVCPDCPMGGGFCSTVWADPCAGFGEDICADVPGCEWIADGEAGGGDPDDPAAGGGGAARPAPCPCEPGPDGEIICDCDPIDPLPPAGGYCQSAPPPGEQCWGYDLDACEADPECAVLEDFGMGGGACPPCEDGRDCAPCAFLVAPIGGCVPASFWCNAQPIDNCDPARCVVEEYEVCGGFEPGGGACPPDQMCVPEPIPPPDGGECWVEQVCTGR